MIDDFDREEEWLISPFRASGGMVVTTLARRASFGERTT